MNPSRRTMKSSKWECSPQCSPKDGSSSSCEVFATNTRSPVHEPIAQQADEDDEKRCFNCGSYKHRHRNCTFPLACVYCLQAGHIVRDCAEMKNDITASKPTASVDELLDYCFQSFHPEEKGPPKESQPTATAESSKPKEKRKHRSRSRSRSKTRDGTKKRKKRRSKSRDNRSKSRSKSPPVSTNRVVPPAAAIRPIDPVATTTPTTVAKPPAESLLAVLEQALLAMEAKAGVSNPTISATSAKSPSPGPAPVSDPETQGKENGGTAVQSAAESDDEDDDDDDDEDFSLNDLLKHGVAPTLEDKNTTAGQNGITITKTNTFQSGPNAVADGKSRATKSPVVSPIARAFDLFDTSTDAVPNLHVMSPISCNMGVDEDRDDADGYYLVRLGEKLKDRYLVKRVLGRGMFGTVVYAEDTKPVPATPENPTPIGTDVAIKIARCNTVMEDAARKELAVLHHLSTDNPFERSRIIAVDHIFLHRKHLCIPMEMMMMNLRDFMKKYGTEEGKLVGLHIDAVRLYGRDLFAALRCLERSGVIHSDIKPDNILINVAMNTVKLCDFGTAFSIHEPPKTPYLCSRFYRSPEIILGCKIGFPADVWAAGCTLYELFTGHILFQGDTNNQMLKLMMALKGRFAKKMLRTAEFREKHFDETFVFLDTGIDLVTKKPVVKRLPAIQSVTDMKTLLRIDHCRDEVESTKVTQLAALLEACLQLDPAQRLTPTAAATLSLFNFGRAGGA